MTKLGKLLVACAATLLVAACGLQLEKAENLSPQGSQFDNSLYAGYVDLARSETGEGDYTDSDNFAIRAMNSGEGTPPEPEEITSRNLPGDKVGELGDARQRLVAALGNPRSRSEFSGDAANAQVMFDCWMQEQEENFQPEDIERCRGGFFNSLAVLEGGLKPVAKAPAPAPEAVQFVVYFGLDKAELGSDAMAVLSEAEAAAKKLGGKVTVAGFTDTSGAANYNQTLSELRAGAVAKAMADGGISSDTISAEGYGQTNLAVPTPDGTVEQGNRRAVIIVAPQ